MFRRTHTKVPQEYLVQGTVHSSGTKIPLLTVFLLSLAMTASAQRLDRCTELVTPAVKEMLSSAYPGYVAPSEFDNASNDVDSQVARGGSGCLGATIGDFDGDDALDMAFLLTRKTKPDEVLLIALRSKRSSPEVIYKFTESDRQRIALETLPAGKYVMTTSVDSTLERGEVRQMFSQFMGVAAGVIGSSEVGFFHLRRGWKHIWLAD